MHSLNPHPTLTSPELNELEQLALGSVTLGRPVLVSLAGSRSYGLSHAASDLDARGVYLAPTEAMLGITSVPEQFIRAEPVDLVLYELGKFANLALSANPGVLEVLHAPVLMSDHVGRRLVENRSLFLSDRVRSRYVGYATGQLKRVEGLVKGEEATDRLKPEKRDKHIRHLFRLLDQCALLLRTGHLELVVDADSVRARAARPLEEVKLMMAAAITEIDAIESVLPPEPDLAGVDALVRSIRLEELEH